MDKIAFLFPGQGSQHVGMGLDIAAKYSEAADIFAEADKSLNFTLRDVMWDGPDKHLSLTEITQPALLTVCVALMEVLAKHGIKPDAAAGLSLGEYPALVAGGSMEFSTAVRLVRERGRLMQEAVPAGKGAVAAVLGLANELVEQACLEVKNGIVSVANYNCPGQVVIAGDTTAVETAGEKCTVLGAKRVIKLPVSAPFHTALLEQAGYEFREFLERASLQMPRIPVTSNLLADYYGNRNPVDLLVEQIYKPVRFEGCVRKLLADGYQKFIEVGPGSTLASFIKKIDKSAMVYSVGNAADVRKLVEVLS